jgi:membrane-bound lytic murein transglycosylase D
MKQDRKNWLALGAALTALGLWGAATVQPVEPAAPRAGAEVVAAALDEAVSPARGEYAADAAGLGAAWDLPNLDHPRVDYWVGRFDTVADMRKKFQGFLDRGGVWAPVILEKLEARGMPRDLLYLAMIESGFNPAAYSHASASGMWQFIAETGQRYGLDIDRAVDERRDPFRATDAALDYLEDLYDRFGSWYLAAAAYNTGENRVGRAMRAEFGREKARSEEDYYRIWDRLPKETRDYVPLMIAAARITKDPAAYGFEPMQLRELAWREVLVDPATPLQQLADRFSTTVDAIRDLNPHFRIHRTPNDRQYAVRIPLAADIAAGAVGIPAD